MTYRFHVLKIVFHSTFQFKFKYLISLMRNNYIVKKKNFKIIQNKTTYNMLPFTNKNQSSVQIMPHTSDIITIKNKMLHIFIRDATMVKFKICPYFKFCEKELRHKILSSRLYSYSINLCQRRL